MSLEDQLKELRDKISTLGRMISDLVTAQQILLSDINKLIQHEKKEKHR